jgi:cell division septal protein FtsQ
VVEVRGRFVRPFAVVRDGDGDHLVDSTGKLLPKSFAPGENPHLIAISGAYFQRPLKPGKVWEGADVGAALTLVKHFWNQPWKSQIKLIDISHTFKGGAITLHTDKACTIIWGGAPGNEGPLELLADGKLQRLNFLYANHGRIDGGHIGEVDITSERMVVTR